MMRISVVLLVIIFLSNFCLSAYSNVRYSESVSINETIFGTFVIKIPIDNLFVDECLSDTGKNILYEIKDLLTSDKIVVACSTNRVHNYNSSWELSNIYVYNVIKFLIQCCEVPTQKISFIGYGQMSRYDAEPNRIEIELIDK